MTPFEAYKIWHALKLHFTIPNYDYFRLKGNRLKFTTFQQKPEQHLFERLARIPDLEYHTATNLLENPKIWVNDLLGVDCRKITEQHSAVKQSLSYYYREDLKKLDPVFDKNFLSVDNQIPPLLNHTITKTINFETLCIISFLVDLIPRWDKMLAFDNVIWPTQRLRLIKYRDFVGIKQTDKYRRDTIDMFNTKQEHTKIQER